MSTFRSLAPQATSRTALAVCILLIAAGAWLALWLLDSPSQALPHHHHHSGGQSETSELALLLFVVGWTLMTVAMMLPTSLPVLTAFHTIAGRRGDRSLLVVLVIAGYLLIWALFGIVVYFGNMLLQWLARSPWLIEHSWAFGPTLLILAGLFQFTPLKYRCLDKCRSPLTFVIGHWQGRHERLQALRLGVDHGIFCVGCCWALMLLMFGVGVGSLVWMMILAMVMGIEKNATWGRRLSAPLGLSLLASGAAHFVFR